MSEKRMHRSDQLFADLLNKTPHIRFSDEDGNRM